MANMHHFNFGTNEGGVTNLVSVSDDGELICRDYQSGAVIQVILDSCAEMRKLNSNGGPPGMGQGYIAARIPITLWQHWRREWSEKYRDRWTWQTFEIMKLNSREYSKFRCIEGKIHTPSNVMG